MVHRIRDTAVVLIVVGSKISYASTPTTVHAGQGILLFRSDRSHRRYGDGKEDHWCSTGCADTVDHIYSTECARAWDMGCSTSLQQDAVCIDSL